MLALDREAGQRRESLAERGFRQGAECGQRVVGLGSREARSVLKPPGRFNCVQYFTQLLAAAVLDGGADHLARAAVGFAQGVNQGERRFALGKINSVLLSNSEHGSDPRFFVEYP